MKKLKIKWELVGIGIFFGIIMLMFIILLSYYILMPALRIIQYGDPLSTHCDVYEFCYNNEFDVIQCIKADNELYAKFIYEKGKEFTEINCEIAGNWTKLYPKPSQLTPELKMPHKKCPKCGSRNTWRKNG